MRLVFRNKMVPQVIFALICATVAAPTLAQAPIVFTPGTGQSSGVPVQSPVLPLRPLTPIRSSIRPLIACTNLPDLTTDLLAKYRAAPPRLALTALAEEGLAAPLPWPAQRLDPMLLRNALMSYARHVCSNSVASGPAEIFIVDFAKRSDQPRLYRVDLRTGGGLDSPVLVAHGIGSDPDDDGIAQSFGNTQDSLMSSLGAARGAEIYEGINGRSLRLDGLDPSNAAMRARDIVVHSYNPNTYRYFNAAYRTAHRGLPGMSEGCFVVEPALREWFFSGLASGGFLYAGRSGAGEHPAESPKPTVNAGAISFVSGTGK
jgi:L,D-transpeptidase catalytic domain